jgi:hypothetical protein
MGTGNRWRGGRCSVPKSEDFARKAARVHWPPSQYGRLDLGGEGSQCAFFGLAAMKADRPTEAPGGLLPNCAQQRRPAHRGAGSHEAMKTWVARASCESCDTPGNYAVLTNISALSSVHKMRWLGAAQGAVRGWEICHLSAFFL